MTNWTHLADLFARIDAQRENTLLVFDDVAIADAYAQHYASKTVHRGVLIRAVDTRTKSGLVVQWRDPIAAFEVSRRQREALWLLEEVLAGRVPRPVAGTVSSISADVEAARRVQTVGAS